MSSTDYTPPLRPVGETARHFQVSTTTIENWLHRGFIRAYRVDGQRTLLYNLDEIDRAFRVHSPKMRDGRRRGAKGRVVAVVVPEGSDQ